jgi:D-glycero-D-manno-heptose 1,7-bisphosphate phosphatase
LPDAATTKLVILVSDGVINFDSASYIKGPDEWVPIPGSLEGIAQLHDAGFLVFVVTNQSGIARGLFSRAALDAIHRKMMLAIEAAGGSIAGVFFCPHEPADGCDCRKPKPGLLRELESVTGLRVAGHALIGDKCSDVDAALAVGARPILVQTGKGAQSLGECADRVAAVYPDLAAAAAAITEENGT